LADPRCAKVRDDLPGRVGLEALHIPAQIGRSGDEMQVVFQYDVAVELEAGFQLQEPPAIQHDIHRFRAGERRPPVVDRCR
jgi:hypothetical protein